MARKGYCLSSILEVLDCSGVTLGDKKYSFDMSLAFSSFSLMHIPDCDPEDDDDEAPNCVDSLFLWHRR